MYELEYSEIPKEFLFCKMKNSGIREPDGYAWVAILNKIPVIRAWIDAEMNLIDQVRSDTDWFKLEIEDLLGEKFESNSDLEYLIKFPWEKGDCSVGIPDGYSCSLVFNSKNEPVTRKYIWGESSV